MTNAANNQGPFDDGGGAPTQLRRALGFWTLTAFGVGDILGAGIYALVGEVAGRAGGLAWGSFLVTVSVAMLTALSYAELGSRFPRSGGESNFCHQATGKPALALLIGYLVVASGTVSLATVTHAFAGYLNEFLGLGDWEWTVIPLFLAVLAGIAFWGIRQSSAVNVVCTLVEATGLLFVIVVGLIYFSGDRPAHEILERQPADWTWVGVLQGGALAFFAFIGFEDMVNVAEEVREPKKNLPAAILTALSVAACMYMAVAWVATAVVPLDVLSQSKAPLLEVVKRAAPHVPEWSFSCVALFAVANTGLLNLVMGSRLLYGMAGQGLLPKWLHVIHEKTKTPYRTIAVIFAIGLALAFSGTLSQLAGTTNVLLLLVFFSVNVSLIVLKFRETEAASGFHTAMPVAVLGAVTCLALIVFLPSRSLLTASLLIAIGIVLVATWGWRLRNHTRNAPEAKLP